MSGTTWRKPRAGPYDPARQPELRSVARGALTRKRQHHQSGGLCGPGRADKVIWQDNQGGTECIFALQKCTFEKHFIVIYQ